MTKKKKVTRKSPLGLDLPTDAQHGEAVALMRPHLKTFQEAADEQTEADLGTSIANVREVNEHTLFKKVKAEKAKEMKRGKRR